MTNKHMFINNKTVANLPLLDTLIFKPLINTYKEPTNTKNSRSKIAYIKLFGINTFNQNNKIIKTTLSVNGSRITPNSDTRLYLLATIPSKESERPIIAIIKTNMETLKS